MITALWVVIGVSAILIMVLLFREAWMRNLRLNYFLLQVINATFFVLSYLYVKEHFNTLELRSLEGFLTLLPFVIAGIYVLFTTRLFYTWIKHKE